MRGDAPSMEMTISDVLLYFNDLCYIISQCKNILNNELEEIKRLFNWNNFLKSKKAIDKISLEDEKQLKFDISQAYDKVTKLLNK
jgi:hypothetical protein